MTTSIFDSGLFFYKHMHPNEKTPQLLDAEEDEQAKTNPSEITSDKTTLTLEDAQATLNNPEWQKIMDWRSWDKRVLTNEEVETALSIVETLHHQPENYSSTELKLLQHAVTNETKRDTVMEMLQKYEMPRFEEAKKQFAEEVRDRTSPPPTEHYAAYVYRSREFMRKVYGFNNTVKAMVNEHVDIKTNELQQNNKETIPQNVSQQQETWKKEGYQLYARLLDEEAQELIAGLQQIKGEGAVLIDFDGDHSAREAPTHLAEHMKKAGLDATSLLHEAKRVIQDGYETAQRKGYIRDQTEVQDIERSLQKIENLITS